MISVSRKSFFSLLLGLCVVVPVISQRACYFEGNIQLCENGNGDYVTVSTSLGSSTTSTTAIAVSKTTTTSQTASATSTSTSASITALMDCHMHGSIQYCMPDPSGTEIPVATQTASETLPSGYTDCHNHDGEAYCVNPEGDDVRVEALDTSEGTTLETEEHVEEHTEEEEVSVEPQNCHFHAGIEHCIGGTTSQQESTCERPDREYNLAIRIGSLFIVLMTSSFAVFGPIILCRFAKGISTTGVRFTVIKQFGTGVIIATAFVHLLTHAQLQFASECLGELQYEGTVTAIAMAGAFVTFLVEFWGARYIMHRRGQRKQSSSTMIKGEGVTSQSPDPEMVHVYREAPAHGHGIEDGDDKLSVWVMEAGIISHSILIGITTVVAGDSGFWQLLIVIIFHQMFEGLALGSRISALSSIPTTSKIIMATVFACITPLGMGIGIGVLKRFNGSDKTTIIALGTLNAFSAGILLWVGFVEMWAGDWVHGYLKRAGIKLTCVAMASLVAGMVLMGVLGKWA